MEDQDIIEYKTKSTGHPISFYYTIIVYCAIIFLFVPKALFHSKFGILYGLGSIVLAIFVAWLPRLFGTMRITRVYLSDTFVQVTANVIQIEDVTRITLVKRQSLFGNELMIFTESNIRCTAFVALKELAEPETLIKDIQEKIPDAVYFEEYAGYHFVDYGLLASIIALIVLIVWRVFL